jgi:hypothetical protein
MSREYSIRNVVRKHAEASTQDNKEPFYFTPTQACLAWWGLFLLVRELGKPIPGSAGDEEFTDDLRSYADAIDWANNTMAKLNMHARRHKLVVLSC